MDKLLFISNTYDQVSDLEITDSGDDAVISYGTSSITVVGYSAAEMSDESLYFWY